MAVLTSDELAKMRQRGAKVVKRLGLDALDWNKPQINAALQDLEDRFETAPPSNTDSIRVALANAFPVKSPVDWTNGQKKIVAGVYLEWKGQKELV